MTLPCKKCHHVKGLHHEKNGCLGATIRGNYWTYCRCRKYEPLDVRLKTKQPVHA